MLPAQSDEDCKRERQLDTDGVITLWSECGDIGRCKHENGACVAASDADCRASAMCKEHGSCSDVGALCGPKSDADCQGSEGCTKYSWCTFMPGIPTGGCLECYGDRCVDAYSASWIAKPAD